MIRIPWFVYISATADKRNTFELQYQGFHELEINKIII